MEEAAVACGAAGWCLQHRLGHSQSWGQRWRGKRWRAEFEGNRGVWEGRTQRMLQTTTLWVGDYSGAIYLMRPPSLLSAREPKSSSQKMAPPGYRPKLALSFPWCPWRDSWARQGWAFWLTTSLNLRSSVLISETVCQGGICSPLKLRCVWLSWEATNHNRHHHRSVCLSSSMSQPALLAHPEVKNVVFHGGRCSPHKQKGWTPIQPAVKWSGGHRGPVASQAAQLRKNLPAKAGDTRDTVSIPGSGRHSRVGNDNPIQCSSLGNAMDTGAWWPTVHGVAKSQIRLRTQAYRCPERRRQAGGATRSSQTLPPG